MPVGFSPRARRDLRDAVFWIACDNPAAAEGLREAVRLGAGQIDAYPDIGRHRLDLASDTYRFLTLTGFPYVLVYNAKRIPPLVVRVLHMARNLPDTSDEL